LQSTQKGLYHDSTFSGLIHDSTISVTFYDSVFARNGSIMRGNNYQCYVFPFWNSHQISEDSLSVGYLDSQKVMYYLNNIIGYGTFYYVQNIGLYKCDYSSSHTSHDVSVGIKLISYNGNKIELGVTNRKKVCINSSSKYNAKKVIVDKVYKHFSDKVINLEGKLILPINKIGPGIVLIKDINK
jgi:hypothetical protein